jgi:hypothetical protein
LLKEELIKQLLLKDAKNKTNKQTKTGESPQLPGETKTKLLLKYQTPGLDAEDVTPELLRLKFYCS